MVSDHFLVSFNLYFHKSENNKRSITYRKIKKIDVFAFRKDISNLPMMADYDKTDLCNAYDTQLRELLDRHTPQITRSASTKHRDPWGTEEVLDALRVKRRAECRFRQTRSDSDYKTFCEKHDIFNVSLNISKTNNLSQVIEDNSRP